MLHLPPVSSFWLSFSSVVDLAILKQWYSIYKWVAGYNKNGTQRALVLHDGRLQMQWNYEMFTLPTAQQKMEDILSCFNQHFTRHRKMTYVSGISQKISKWQANLQRICASCWYSKGSSQHDAQLDYYRSYRHRISNTTPLECVQRQRHSQYRMQ